MLSEKQMEHLSANMKRIFAMPITRSTFREMQNAIMEASGGNTTASNQIFESLMTGKLPKDEPKNGLEYVVKEYTVLARLSKDVFEMGEFINLVSSDIFKQNNRVGFVHRIRRVDGQELQFVTDSEGTVNLLKHLATRLHELKKDKQLKQH